jgi:predicted mannosyl-3-phosphoglycerate phosphatase (HAD superfamily)
MMEDDHDDCDERIDSDDRDQDLNESNNISHNSLQDELGELRNELEDFEDEQGFTLKPSFEQD